MMQLESKLSPYTFRQMIDVSMMREIVSLDDEIHPSLLSMRHLDKAKVGRVQACLFKFSNNHDDNSISQCPTARSFRNNLSAH